METGTVRALPGINAIGPVRAPGDAGIVARSVVAALLAAGVDVAIAATGAGADARFAARTVDRIEDLPHPVNLFLDAPPAAAALLAAAPARVRGLRHALLATLDPGPVPPDWAAAVRRFAIVFAPNAFVAGQARALAGGSVRPIPFVPWFALPAGPAAPGNALRFVAVLDTAGDLERQYPNALLTAFVRAFAGRRDVELTILSLDPGADPARFTAITAQYPNVRFVPGGREDERVPAELAAADAFVALDRGDGLALHAYAALARGLPLAGTDAGALCDVLDETTGFPIAAALAAAGNAGATWAEPDVGAAAAALRRILEEPAVAAARAAAGAARLAARRAAFADGAWLAPLVPRAAAQAPALPARTAATPPAPLRIVLEGEYRSPLSLAHINRELGLRLARDPSIDFSGVEHAPAPDPAIELAAELAARVVPAASPLGPADVRVTLHWPPFLERRGAHRYVAFLPWEMSEIPATWRAAIERGIDAVWTLSEHSRAAFLRAGIAPHKVAVVPLGIDAALLHPGGPVLDLGARSFRFLYVGGTIGRKGFDFVDRAYFRNFGPGDDVTLIVKDVGTASVYRDDHAGAYLRALAARRDVAHVIYLDATLSDAEMAALYRAGDVLLAPYRAEGFGLPTLEAMACGVPPIVTGGGASDDFVDDGCGVRLPSRRVAAPDNVGVELVGPAWVLEPDLDALADAMHGLIDERERRAALGAAAAARAATWTWDRTAALARAAIAAVVAAR